MRVRDTARVVVLDSSDRVLMLHLHYPYVIDPANPTGAGGGEPFWAVPGGGLQPGESFAEAAIRELREETGIDVPTVDRWLWSRDKHLQVRGEDVLFRERYGLVRLAAPVILSRELLAGDESVALLDMRWMALAELARSVEPVTPLGLVDLLRPVLRGDVPGSPLRLDR